MGRRALNTESRRAVSQWFLMNGFVTASWVAHVPRQSAALGASPGQLGLALLCMALGSVAGMAVAPRAIGRFGAGRAAWAAGVGYALLLPLPLLAGSLPVLGLALLCFGAVHGLMDVTMNTAAAACEKDLGRPVMAGFHGWFSVGMVAGVGGGVAALSAGLSPAGHAAVAIGLSVVLLASGRPVRGFVPAAAESRRDRPAGIDCRAVTLAGLAFACLFLEGAMADWAGLLAAGFGAGPAAAPLAYGAFTVAWAGGRFLGDRVTAIAGDVLVVRAGGLLAAAGITAALCGGSPGWVAAGCGVVGLGLANVVPVLFRAGAGGDAAGRGLALVTGVGYFGFLVGPPLVGFSAEGVGLPQAMLLVVAGGLVLAAGAAALRRRPTPAGGGNDRDAEPGVKDTRSDVHHPMETNHARREHAPAG